MQKNLSAIFLPPLFVLMLWFAMGNCLHSQSPPKSGFTVLNLTPKTLNLRILAQTNLIAQLLGPEALDSGSSTGLLPYSFPPGSLRLETKEYGALEVAQAIQKAGETPFLVLEEKPGAKALQVLVLPNASRRVPVSYDAINLTPQASLKIRANNKMVEMPRGERVRLAEEKILRYLLDNQPEEVLETIENDNFLLIFFRDPKGKIQSIVSRDNLL